MFKNFILFTFIFFTAFLCSSQTTTKIVFQFQTKNCFVKINNKVLDIDKTNEIEISSGTYPLQIYSPHFNILYDTIDVISNKTNSYRKTLTDYNKDYTDYLANVKTLKIKKGKKILATFLNISVPITLLTTNTIASKIEIDKHKNLLLTAKDIYENEVIRNINVKNARITYEETLKKYKNKINIANTGTAAALCLLGGGIYLSFLNPKRTKIKQLELPTYNEKNPFLVNINFLENLNDKQIALKLKF